MKASESAKHLDIFVVEDEALLRLMIVDMLEELGHRVCCEAGHLDQAVIMAGRQEFDLALLDVNLAGKIILPVAEIIDARKRPFVFVTGYGPPGVPERFRDRPCVRKPFLLEILGQTIDLAVAAHQARSVEP